MKNVDLRKAGFAAATVLALVAMGVLLMGRSGGSSLPDAATPLATPVAEMLDAGIDAFSSNRDSIEVAPPVVGVPVPAPGDEGGMTGGDNAPAGGEGFSPTGISDRKIIRTATVTVTVADVGAAVGKVESAATAAGGFVSNSTFTTVAPAEGDDPEATPAPEQSRATITIRVPAEMYQSVVNEIRGLGDVTSLSSNTSEVTEEYTDLEAQLRHLEATEARYLELMGSASQINDILTLEDRLNQVRLEMEQVKGRLQLLTDLTDLATITVEIVPPLASSGQAAVQQPGWAEEAWENAWSASQEVMRAMGVAAITGGVILAWLIIPATVLIVAWRMLGGRKGGESAAS